MKRLMISAAAGAIGTRVLEHILKRLPQDSPLELVGLNDPVGIDEAIRRYNESDPVHGAYDFSARRGTKNTVFLRGREFPFSDRKNIPEIPLEDLKVDMVIECSGFFGDPKQGEVNGGREFLKHGVKTVVETYPAKTADASLIMGVNHELYHPGMQVISNASCTTKSLGLPIKVLQDNGIEVKDEGMVTVHAATGATKKELIEARSRIPTKEENKELYVIETHSTGATKALGIVIPSLKGKMGGTSARVPTLDGSISYKFLTVTCEGELTAEKINQMMQSSVNDPRYAGRIGVLEGEVVSSNQIVGRRESSLILLCETKVRELDFAPKGKRAYHVTIAAGYDNELGSAADAALLADYIARRS